jgi:hypothetical protein
MSWYLCGGQDCRRSGPAHGGRDDTHSDNQDVLLVCFYNLLPDGILGSSAEPLLQAMLPLGATLRIKEPFYKIYGDGQRGIRVDNPRDLEIVASFKLGITTIPMSR